MKSKCVTKVLSVVGSVAMLAGLATMGFGASAEDAEKKIVEYKYDFSDAAQLNDFESYYIATGTEEGEKTDWQNYWTLNTETGKLERKKVDGPGVGTGESNTLLYFTKDQFQFFEAEYTFEFGSGWGWAELGFGAEEKGYHMESANLPSGGIFMQQEGYVDLFWANDMIPDEPGKPGNRYPNQFGAGETNYRGEEGKDANTSYCHSVPHTLKIKVTPGETADTVKIFLSAKSGDKEEVVLLDGTKEFTDAYIANNEGYIFLQAQNDTVAYDSLVIRPLDENGDYIEEETEPSDDDTTPSDEDTTPSDDDTTPSDEDTTPSDEDTTTAGDTDATEPTSPSTGVAGSAVPALLMLGAGAAFVAAFAVHKKGNK